VSDSLIEAAATLSNPIDRRVYGVAPAQVVSNRDARGEGRVQVKLPWLPGHRPWARVAMPTTGSGTGVFLMPQEGDEVLVAFGQGDVRDPFVVGSLWNGRDKPPATAITDPQMKRVIKTPAGHVITLDDSARSVEIKTADGQRVLMDAKQIVVDAGKGAAKLTLAAAGDVTLEAKKQLTLKGATVNLEASAGATLKGETMELTGNTTCTISGKPVRLN
jgi:uncharacterized protein involved in type VI secretion and phage assembly